MSENLNLRDQFSEYNNLENMESNSLVRCTNIWLLTANCSLDIQESSANLVSSTGWKYYKKFEESPITSPSPSPEDKCTATSGFIYNAGENMCYFIGSPLAVDFDVIDTVCSNMDSELIRIDSQEKQAFVQQLLAADAGDRVCIQGNRDNDSGSYKFDDGTDMTYFNWNTPFGQPDDPSWDYTVMAKNSTIYGMILQRKN
ncbi:unnamed protein product [Mytilus coruscus]|uniref:C-type lectin domain-containing protein n=1 Tax=Mytilus coruscus TaxID=42192 RepID=A0A6J8DJH4_MYTCO|nr:unnamed protein product [Mytilus coruscus]